MKIAIKISTFPPHATRRLSKNPSSNLTRSRPTINRPDRRSTSAFRSTKRYIFRPRHRAETPERFRVLLSHVKGDIFSFCWTRAQFISHVLSRPHYPMKTCDFEIVSLGPFFVECRNLCGI